MHLALVSHNLIRGDGQGRVNYEIAAHGLRRGHQVTLFADRVDPDLLQLGAVWVPVRPAVRRPILLKAIEFAARADRSIAGSRGRFDVICANGFTVGLAHTVNCVHFVHGAWLHSPVHPFGGRSRWYRLYQGFNTAVNARIEKRVLGAARTLVAVSRRVAGELERCGIIGKDLHVIHNGVDPEEFHPGAEPRAQLGLPEGPLALFIGDLRTPRKNLDRLLEALRTLPGLRLAVLGDQARSDYPRLCAEMGLADRVHFLGYRRDVAAIMRACDLLAAPSRYEPFGLTVLEAMASGLPVVTAATCGAAELVTPDCGHVVENPEDAAAIGEALGRLVSDPAARKRMGLAGRQIALAHSWQKMAESYWTLFGNSR